MLANLLMIVQMMRNVIFVTSKFFDCAALRCFCLSRVKGQTTKNSLLLKTLQQLKKQLELHESLHHELLQKKHHMIMQMQDCARDTSVFFATVFSCTDVLMNAKKRKTNNMQQINFAC